MSNFDAKLIKFSKEGLTNSASGEYIIKKNFNEYSSAFERIVQRLSEKTLSYSP